MINVLTYGYTYNNEKITFLLTVGNFRNQEAIEIFEYFTVLLNYLMKNWQSYSK